MVLDIPLGERFTFTYQGPTVTKRYQGRLIEHSTTLQNSTRTGNPAEEFIRIETKWSALVCKQCGVQSKKIRKGARYCPNGHDAGFEKATIWRPISYVVRFILNWKVL